MKKKIVFLTIFIINIILLLLLFWFKSNIILFIILLLIVNLIHYFADYILISKKDYNYTADRINAEEIDKFISHKFYRILINKEKKIYYTSNKTKTELNLNIFDNVTDYIPERIINLELKELKIDIKGNKYIYYRIMNSIYLWPISEQEKYKKLYQESVNGIGYIYLDNFSEITNNISEINKYEVLSKYYTYVEKMFENYNIIGKRISTTKYFFVSTIASYREIKNDNFQILKNIYEIISEGEKLTASIGFSLSASTDSMESIDIKARDSVNLALERGGNQVVEIINGELKYIGGKTSVSAKRSRVRVRVFSNNLNARINSSEEIILFGHKNLDMDCFASLVVMAKYITSKFTNKKVSINVNLQNSSFDVRNTYELLSEEEKKKFIKFPEVKKNSLLIVLDASNSKVIYDVNDLKKSDNILIIDHHIRENDDILSNKGGLVDVSASSTAELICDILEHNEYLKYIGKNYLTMLYSAIIIDTNNLSQKANSQTFEALSKLISYGASINESFDLRQDSYDFIKEKNDVISSVVVYKSIYAIAESTYIWSNTKIAKTANEILSIKEFQVSFVISKTNDGIKVSARSNNGVHVGNIMSKLGGGGHATIAACLFPSNEKNIINKLKDAIEENNNY